MFNRSLALIVGAMSAAAAASVSMAHTFPLLTSLGAERPHRSAGSVGKTYRYRGTDWSDTRNGKREVARRLRQKRHAELKATYFDLSDREQREFTDLYNKHGRQWNNKTARIYAEVMGGV